MIAFIEGGMRLPMDNVTRDYLIAHRLCPHQCAPNLFMVLGSVDTLNEQMGLNLTWHGVIWMYSAICLQTRAITLSLGLLLLGLSRVSPNPTRA